MQFQTHGLLPIAYHRACSRHVYANFSKSFAGAQLKQLFGKLPRAVTSMILMRHKAEKEAAFE